MSDSICIGLQVYTCNPLAVYLAKSIVLLSLLGLLVSAEHLYINTGVKGQALIHSGIFGMTHIIASYSSPSAEQFTASLISTETLYSLVSRPHLAYQCCMHSEKQEVCHIEKLGVAWGMRLGT